MIMAGTALMIRSIAMVFRIFLAGALGTEGMGLYQLVMSIYVVFAAVSSSGISLCTTRLFSDNAANGNYGKGRYLTERSFGLSMFIGGAACVLMFALSEPAAKYVLGDVRCAPALRILAPGLPFMSASACIRGYFCARRNTLIPSGEQLLEQVIETGVFAVLFLCFTPNNLSDACCMTVAGTAAAEAVSFIYAVMCYRHDVKKAGFKVEMAAGFLKHSLPILLPVSANALMRSGLSAAENALIPRGLQKHGMTETEALSRYGIISGMTLPLLVFPSVMIMPFALLIIPEIAELNAKSSRKSIKRITEKMVSAALVYSVPITVIFMFFSVPIGKLFFHNSEAGRLLGLLAPVVPFMYLDSVADGILKGLNEQTSYFVFNTIDSVLRVVLTLTLLPFAGIMGAAAVIIISELLNTMMSVLRLIKITEFRLRIINDIIIPAAVSAGVCITAGALPVIFGETADTVIKLVFSAGMCIFFLSRTRKLRPAY